ncbi:MAG: hypothetical protein Q9179_006174 [Wetmoreana sp. 5 TL-2023]
MKRVFLKDMSYHIIPPTHSLNAKPQSLQHLFAPTDASNPTLLPTSILHSFQFVFLIRKPSSSVPSLYRCFIPPLSDQTDERTLDPTELGYRELRILFDYLHPPTSCLSEAGPVVTPEEGDRDNAPLLIDAEDYLENPDAIIRSLCSRLVIPYSPSMLTWDTAEDHAYALSLFEKFAGYHEDALNSTGLKPKPPGRAKSKKEEDQEWESKYGSEAAVIIRQAVDTCQEDYKYLRHLEGWLGASTPSPQLLNDVALLHSLVEYALNVFWFNTTIPDASAGQGRYRVVSSFNVSGWLRNLVIRREIYDDIPCERVTTDVADHTDVHRFWIGVFNERLEEKWTKNTAAAISGVVAADQDRGFRNGSRLNEVLRKLIMLFVVTKISLDQMDEVARMMEKDVREVEKMGEESERGRISLITANPDDVILSRWTYIMPCFSSLHHILDYPCHIALTLLILDPRRPVALSCRDDKMQIMRGDCIVQRFAVVDSETRR